MATTVGALRRCIEGLPDKAEIVVVSEGCFCDSPKIYVDSTKRTKPVLIIDCEDLQTFWEIDERPLEG
jgi:hypothetical protein